MFPLENKKMPKEEAEKKALEYAKIVGIEGLMDRKPGQLSGGQQQRVAIARTLAPKPKVLFMDEPLSNLDAKLRGEMRTELKRLHLDTNSTFIYVTHDQLEAMTLATRICLIEKGNLQQYDPPLVVYNRPNNLFVADFVGNPTMNFVPCKVGPLDKKTIEVEFYGIKGIFHGDKEFELTSNNAILGIRPEFLPISPNGKITGIAYSTLPAGMETTVKISLNGNILSSVVFGSIDYTIDEEIKFDIISEGIVLFDPQTKENISLGSIEIK